MSYLEIVVIGLSLAMDALAVAVCKGIAIGKIDIRRAFYVGGYFGFFQALMPLIGFFLGKSISEFLVVIDHWVIFCLFVILGANMIFECWSNKSDSLNSYIDFSSMVLPAIATSIDALVIGISFALIDVNIILAIIIIGVISFILTSIGVLLGSKIGERNSNITKFIGGLVLIIIGIKTLIEHLCT